MTTRPESDRRRRWITLGGGLAAFGTYFCMYAFRKPFTAISYPDAAAVGAIDFKVALVIAQILGYALAKFVGIKFISELQPRRRLATLLALMLVAEGGLIGFGFTAGHWTSVLMLFLNGFPLGMIWGIVFSYIEGRRATELLGGMLCTSFILSSGAVKSVGAALAQLPWVTDYWMPAATGALFLLPLLLFAVWLDRTPPPDAADRALKTRRAPMTAADRRLLLRRLGPGFPLIVLYYVTVTAFRDIRDSFAAEIWTALGYGDTPSIFTLSELPIALLTLLTLVVGYFLRDNRRALHYYHGLILLSTLLILGATFSYRAGVLDGAYWMVLVGLGLFLGFVPLNAIYFDRLLAAFRQVATATFLIYVADAAGYAGSIGVLFTRTFFELQLSWLEFFVALCYAVGALGTVFLLGSWWSFNRRLATVPAEEGVT